jgi:hypothetical protein
MDSGVAIATVGTGVGGTAVASTAHATPRASAALAAHIIKTRPIIFASAIIVAVSHKKYCARELPARVTYKHRICAALRNIEYPQPAFYFT